MLSNFINNNNNSFGDMNENYPNFLDDMEQYKFSKHVNTGK